MTISEAIAANSFFPYGKMLIRGKPTTEAFKDWDFCFEDGIKMGRLENLYVKAGAATVIPWPEDGEMGVWSSTQSIMEVQELVVQVPRVPSSRKVAKVKQMGGWFSGKESKAAQLACILAVAAKKLLRPVSCKLNCDEDMYVFRFYV